MSRSETRRRVLAKDRLVVSAEPVAKVPGRGGATFRLQQLLGALPKAVVAGVPTVSRAVMNRAKGGALQLFAEGTNLKVGLGVAAPSVLRSMPCTTSTQTYYAGHTRGTAWAGPVLCSAPVLPRRV
jgi:hypothetical protein